MRTNVTYEQIATAAESITANGTNPTIERIRMHLGNRGSNSTISKYLNNWRRNTNTPRECYINHCTPLNENITHVQKPTTNIDSMGEVEKLKHEIVLLHNKVAELKSKYTEEKQEADIAKNNLANAIKYHNAWKEEKDKYITDLKQAHKLSLMVLKEHYQEDINNMEQKISFIVDKIDKYTHRHNKERENFIIRLQKMKNLLVQMEKEKEIIKQKLLVRNIRNKVFKKSLNKRTNICKVNQDM